MMTSSNRILAAVARMTKQVEDRIAAGLTTPAAVADLNNKLDMELDEYVKFQELKSLAFAEGKLNEAEASAVYSYLGNTPDVFNRQPIAVKSVLTQLYAELLQAKMKRMGVPVPA